MQHRILGIALVAATLGFASQAQAGYPLPQPKVHVFQQHRLTGTGHVQTWQSRMFPPRATVYAHLYQRGHEIPQRWINNCSAAYTAAGLLVRLRVVNCKGHFSFRLRYVSVSARQRFEVRLTASSEG